MATLEVYSDSTCESAGDDCGDGNNVTSSICLEVTGTPGAIDVTITDPTDGSVTALTMNVGDPVQCFEFTAPCGTEWVYPVTANAVLVYEIIAYCPCPPTFNISAFNLCYTGRGTRSGG